MDIKNLFLQIDNLKDLFHEKVQATKEIEHWKDQKMGLKNTIAISSDQDVKKILSEQLRYDNLIQKEQDKIDKFNEVKQQVLNDMEFNEFEYYNDKWHYKAKKINGNVHYEESTSPYNTFIF
ncbi:hypothetical protein N9L92_01030 [Saprospiraceae bacterium]|nr:hypothetical protein [Saprospiraceae bacterium]